VRANYEESQSDLETEGKGHHDEAIQRKDKARKRELKLGGEATWFENQQIIPRR
jgi:hypothetical protein